jgi:phage repressor protein C with HTH and peptisase S24 domain
MLEINVILFRLKTHFQVRTNSELAQKIGTTLKAISNWVERRKIPTKKLYEIASKENISYDWLMTGKGEKKLPFLGQSTDSILQSEALKTKVSLPSFATVSPNAYWYQYTGESMSPTIEDLEYVVVEPNENVKNGDICLIEVGGKQYILQLHVEDDGRHIFRGEYKEAQDEIALNKQCKVIGKVIYILKDTHYNN